MSDLRAEIRNLILTMCNIVENSLDVPNQIGTLSIGHIVEQAREAVADETSSTFRLSQICGEVSFICAAFACDWQTMANLYSEVPHDRDMELEMENR